MLPVVTSPPLDMFLVMLAVVSSFASDEKQSTVIAREGSLGYCQWRIGTPQFHDLKTYLPNNFCSVNKLVLLAKSVCSAERNLRMEGGHAVGVACNQGLVFHHRNGDPAVHVTVRSWHSHFVVDMPGLYRFPTLQWLMQFCRNYLHEIQIHS